MVTLSTDPEKNIDLHFLAADYLRGGAARIEKFGWYTGASRRYNGPDTECALTSLSNYRDYGLEQIGDASSWSRCTAIKVEAHGAAHDALSAEIDDSIPLWNDRQSRGRAVIRKMRKVAADLEREAIKLLKERQA